jgi:hypothetical protein
MRPRKDLKWIRSNQGCFEITSHCKDRWGYPTIRRNGKLLRFSRYVYEYFNGPIAPGLVIRHKCDNPACVALSHLQTGTIFENNRDRDKRGRTAKGTRVGNSRLNHAIVRMIRKDMDHSNAELARIHGVSKNAIQNVRTRQTWAHV